MGEFEGFLFVVNVMSWPKAQVAFDEQRDDISHTGVAKRSVASGLALNSGT